MRGVFTIRICGWRGAYSWVEEIGALGMTGYDSYFVCMIKGEVSVDKNKKVCDGF